MFVCVHVYIYIYIYIYVCMTQHIKIRNTSGWPKPPIQREVREWRFTAGKGEF